MRVACCVSLVVVLAACSTLQFAPEAKTAATELSTGELLMSRMDLERASSRGSLLDAMAGVRPKLQRSRAVMVSVDGGVLADASILNVIRAADVAEVRLMRASRGIGAVGVAANGDVVAADVIQVFTRRR